MEELLFPCDQCLGSFTMVRKVMRYKNCGFMCDGCWKLFHKRIREIMHPFITIDEI